MIHHTEADGINSYISNDREVAYEFSKCGIAVAAIPFHYTNVCPESENLHKHEHTQPGVQQSSHYRVYLNGASGMKPENCAQQIRKADQEQ